LKNHESYKELDKMLVTVNKDNFKEVVENSQIPVLLDFGATWCPHCQNLLPKLEELSKKTEGKLVVAAIDTDENPEIAAAMHIEYIPALFVYKDGAFSDMLVAPESSESLENWLKEKGAL
jgi:thioredoxin